MPTVAFDVLGTLFLLDPPRDEFERLGAPDVAFDAWLAQSLRDYFAISHAGGYAPLADVLRAGLPRTLGPLGIGVDEQIADLVMSAFEHSPPAPGAHECVTRFADAGWRILAVTNGAESTARALLEEHELADAVSDVLSCDALQVSKPDARVYEAVRDRAEGELWMAAAHAWDVDGAARAGLRTAWIASGEGVYPSTHLRPDVVAADLDEASTRILERAGDLAA